MGLMSNNDGRDPSSPAFATPWVNAYFKSGCLPASKFHQVEELAIPALLA